MRETVFKEGDAAKFDTKKVQLNKLVSSQTKEECPTDIANMFSVTVHFEVSKVGDN